MFMSLYNFSSLSVLSDFNPILFNFMNLLSKSSTAVEPKKAKSHFETVITKVEQPVLAIFVLFISERSL